MAGQNSRTAVIILIAIAVALPVVAFHGMGGHGNVNVKCNAQPTGASGDASASNPHGLGSRAYAMAEVEWMDTSNDFDEDGPNDDPYMTEAYAEVNQNGMTQLALTSDSHAYGENYWGGGPDDTCIAQFDWISYGLPDFEAYSPTLKDQILAVTCTSSTGDSSYAYSGEIYYNSNTTTTYLWQGSDGVDITTTPYLNSGSTIITSISSQFEATRLHVESFGSGSWGCKLRFAPQD